MVDRDAVSRGILRYISVNGAMQDRTYLNIAWGEGDSNRCDKKKCLPKRRIETTQKPCTLPTRLWGEKVGEKVCSRDVYSHMLCCTHAVSIHCSTDENPWGGVSVG